MNQEIKANELRCLGEDGFAYGVISRYEAIGKARDLNLDLVLISPDANPPVAKIMDYGKFKYEQERKKKEARKNQQKIVLKETKLSVKIAQNDINYKIERSRKFLEAGYHVKFRVFLKGREMQNPDAGKDVLNRVWPMVEDIGIKDNEPKFEGRFINMLVLPKKELKSKN
ncbi:MAG: translation initiation factor IF-3 [Epsilonproteobacteria bacterium]|nr:MAG: translation initiation factor IF-3 [Campylobacteraceae bacterium 4484_166]RLA75326.1 MAG: translation initiation factor IF-3 [Campylobacterota bacterium]